MRRREAAGLSREEAARQLEWSISTIFRIETGRSRPQPGNVRVLLDLYGVTGAERDGLIQLARESRQPGWWHSFRDVLPNPYEVYIGLEAGAASIRNFEPVVIPGLSAAWRPVCARAQTAAKLPEPISDSCGASSWKRSSKPRGTDATRPCCGARSRLARERLTTGESSRSALVHGQQERAMRHAIYLRGSILSVSVIRSVSSGQIARRSVPPGVRVHPGRISTSPA